MKRTFSKTHKVSTHVKNQCSEVLIFKSRQVEDKEADYETHDGVEIIAWHSFESLEVNGDDEYILQQEFIIMPEEMIEDYIRDFSALSAQNFIDRFKN